MIISLKNMTSNKLPNSRPYYYKFPIFQYVVVSVCCVRLGGQIFYKSPQGFPYRFPHGGGVVPHPLPCVIRDK